MDNIAFHHSKEVVDAIKQRNSSILYCIAYSPKLNCVENVFGMLKPFYRRMCPPEFNKSFDYKYLFENLLYEELYEKSQLNYFQHVRNISVNTLESIDSDPNFKFNGYDL